MKQSLVVLGIGASSSLVLALIFFRSVFIYPTRPMASDTDMAHQYFLIENAMTTIVHGDWPRLFETRMFYPLRTTRAFGNSFLGQALAAAVVDFLVRDPIASVNIVIVASFIITFMATYMVVSWMTKNVYAALVAALIFTYNPVVLARLPHQIELVTTLWIPFFFGALFAWRRNRRSWWSIAAAYIWVMQLFFSASYALILLIIGILYVLFELMTGGLRLRDMLRFPIAFSLIGTVVVVFWYTAPYRDITTRYGLVGAAPAVVRALSLHLADFAFPSPNNVVWGAISRLPEAAMLRESYARTNYPERSAFPGLIAIVLLGSIIVRLFTKNVPSKDRHTLDVLLFLGIVAIVLALGPVLSVGKLELPLVYGLLARLIPVLGFLRAPSRFLIVAVFTLAVLAGYAWRGFLIKVRQKAVWTVVACALLILEYLHGLPPPQQIRKDAMELSRWLRDQHDSRVVLELPMGNSLPQSLPMSRSAAADMEYLLPAVYHQKLLVNGYHSFNPPQVLALGTAMTVNFPTSGKIDDLRAMGVDLVVVHVSGYADRSSGQDVVNGLRKLALPEVYTAPTIRAFSLRAVVSSGSRQTSETVVQ